MDSTGTAMQNSAQSKQEPYTTYTGKLEMILLVYAQKSAKLRSILLTMRQFSKHLKLLRRKDSSEKLKEIENDCSHFHN